MTERARYQRAWTIRKWGLRAMLAALVGLSFGLSWSDDLGVRTACLAGIVIAITLFYRFRCPRCGQRFVNFWKRLTGPKTQGPLCCAHCGLAVNEIPKETSP